MSHEVESTKDISGWIGGFFCWMIKGFSGSRNQAYQPKYTKRNIWVGYIVEMILLLTFVYFTFIR